MNSECEYCKKYIMQGGRCYERKRNCIMFDPEPRGKVVRKTIKIPFDFDSSYGKVECHKPVTLVDGKYEFEATVIKIKSVDTDNGEIIAEIDYHENDWTPRNERLKRFRILTFNPAKMEGKTV